MPKYRITLLEVEAGDDDTAKLVGYGCVAQIRGNGGNVGGLAIQGPSPSLTLLDVGLGDITSTADLLQAAAKHLMAHPRHPGGSHHVQD